MVSVGLRMTATVRRGRSPGPVLYDPACSLGSPKTRLGEHQFGNVGGMANDQNNNVGAKTPEHPYRESVFASVYEAKGDAFYRDELAYTTASQIGADLSAGKLSVFTREEIAGFANDLRILGENNERRATKLKTKYTAILASTVSVALAAFAVFKAFALAPILLAGALVLVLVLANGLAEAEAAIGDAKRTIAVCDRLDKHCESLKASLPTVEELSGTASKMADVAERFGAAVKSRDDMVENIRQLEDRVMRIEGKVGGDHQPSNVRVEVTKRDGEGLDTSDVMPETSAEVPSQQNKRDNR